MSRFPSKYLKGDDIEVGSVLTIKGVQFEEVGFEKEEKPVIYFEEELRGCVCNKTIARTLVKAFGDDEKTWPGKKVIATTEVVHFRGEVTNALRLHPAPAERKKKANL